jgi:SpoVK/Ycf46/Vps4 family AAA+-type ATPase
MDVLHRLELIDDAMLRPGRLGKLLYVPLPDATDRIAILKALVRSVIGPSSSPHSFYVSHSSLVYFTLETLLILTHRLPTLVNGSCLSHVTSIVIAKSEKCR